MKLNLSQPNLTEHPPRSLRVRIGGYAHLARLLDKARASLAGLSGDYHYKCPLDKHFFAFTGISDVEMLAAIKTGKSDTEILAWVSEKTKRLPFEIVAWSTWVEQNGPGGSDGHIWMAETIKADAPGRTDVRSFVDLLDMDDYVSFGGKA